MRTEDKTVVLTPQLQADLRLAWKLLDDAGHKAAEGRVFQTLEGAGVPATDRT